MCRSRQSSPCIRHCAGVRCCACAARREHDLSPARACRLTRAAALSCRRRAHLSRARGRMPGLADACWYRRASDRTGRQRVAGAMPKRGRANCPPNRILQPCYRARAGTHTCMWRQLVNSELVLNRESGLALGQAAETCGRPLRLPQIALRAPLLGAQARALEGPAARQCAARAPRATTRPRSRGRYRFAASPQCARTSKPQ
jgi:hypothetical protein